MSLIGIGLGMFATCEFSPRFSIVVVVKRLFSLLHMSSTAPPGNSCPR